MKNEISVEFMLAEFNALQTHVIKLEDAKSSRVNFFLIVVAAITASVPGLMGSANWQNIASLVVTVAALGVFILGLTILSQLIIYSEAIIGLYRRAGRIRRWFTEADQAIVPYLPFHASDDQPTMNITAGYFELRGGDVIIRMLNSLSFAIFVIALLSVFFSIPSPAMLAGLLPLAAVAWYIQQYIIKARLKQIDEHMKRRIRFPEFRIAEAEDARPHLG